MLAKHLKIDKESAGRIISTRIKETTAPMPKFNVGDAANSLRARFRANTNQRNYNAYHNPDGSVNEEEREKWKPIFDGHDADTLAAIEGAEADMAVWLNANPDSNPVQQARAFQGFLNYRKSQSPRIAQQEAHAWAHLGLDLFKLEWDTAANTAATLENEDKKKRTAAKTSLFMTSVMERAIGSDPIAVEAATSYNQAKQNIENQKAKAAVKASKLPFFGSQLYKTYMRNLDILDYYYSSKAKDAYKRRMTDRYLAHQAAHVAFNDSVGPLSTAINLPDSRKKICIYRPIDTEKTGSISRVDTIIAYNKKGVPFTVEIIDTPNISQPVPSIRFQETFGLIGLPPSKRPAHMFFKDNQFIFTAPPPKKSKSNKNQSRRIETNSSQPVTEESSEQQTYEDNPNLLFASDDYVIDEYGTVHYVGDGLYDHHETYVDGNLPF